MKLSSQITKKIVSQKKLGKRIVLVTGVFDLLHQEHLNFLTKAKKIGDFLVVALESDVRVRQMKGPLRPQNNQEVRVNNIKSLKIADLVFLLPEEFDHPQDREDFIARLQPDILAVSAHTNFLDQKRQIMEKFGGKLIVVHQHNPQVSSTIILNGQNKTK